MRVEWGGNKEGRGRKKSSPCRKRKRVKRVKSMHGGERGRKGLWWQEGKTYHKAERETGTVGRLEGREILWVREQAVGRRRRKRVC